MASLRERLDNPSPGAHLRMASGRLMDIEDVLRYCASHCDSDDESALIAWVEEKFREAKLIPADTLTSR